jgi:hypothetical protein
MAMVVDEESEQQRMETKAKAKEAADAAAREPLQPPPPFLTHQNFAQYMRMADERQQMLIECQSKMMQDVMTATVKVGMKECIESHWQTF